MARKTFISYKHSDAENLRNAIIDALGEGADYYRGERPESPDRSDEKAEIIKKDLKDMMWNTSVTIVIISPNMKESEWIDWEIAYSLKSVTRKDRTSHPNGIVGVIMKVDDGYDWFKSTHQNSCGCSAMSYKEDKVFDIIKNNRYNQIPKQYICPVCEGFSQFEGSYISYVEEDEFLKNHEKYIENAYEKSEDDACNYRLEKERSTSEAA